jgi:hypothetical protein
MIRSPSSMARFLTTCVVHAPLECAVTPRTCTRRVVTSVTNSTYSRRRLIVSTWKKSHANSPVAWARRNARQSVSRGAGPRRVAARIRRIVPAPT